MGRIRPSESRNIDYAVSRVHYKPPEWREDPTIKHSQLAKQNDTDGKDLQSDVQELDDYIACSAKCLSILSTFQHMWNGHLGQIKGLGIESI